MLQFIKPMSFLFSLSLAACGPSALETSSLNSDKMAKKEVPMKSLYGDWDILKVVKGEVEIDATALSLKKLVIAKDRMQYGNEFPYLSTPRIVLSPGRIVGVIIDGTENKREDEITEINKSLPDCRRVQLLDYIPEATAEDVGCLVFRVYATRPIAEPTDLPDRIELVSEKHKDLRVLIRRSK